MKFSARLIFVTMVVVLVAAGIPMEAAAQKQTCFCCSPWPSKGAATGKKAGSRNKPSTITITFRKPGGGRVTATNNPSAGDTCEAIMNDLAAQLAAAGCTVGPVGAGTRGRFVFCVDGHMSGPSTKENDTGIREVTYRKISRPTDPFLRGVVFAYVDDAKAEGGYVALEIYTYPDDSDEELIVEVAVETFPGQTGADVNQALIDVLNDAGFVASLGNHEFSEEDGLEPAIFIDAGIYQVISGIGMISEDEGLNITATGDFEPGVVAVPIPDVGGDGTVDNADFRAFLEDYALGSPAADLNLDGVVDENDLNALFSTLRNHLILRPEGLGKSDLRSMEP